MSHQDEEKRQEWELMQVLTNATFSTSWMFILKETSDEV